MNDAFGWINEGRTSEACRRATVDALRRCGPYLVLWLVVLAGVAVKRAEAMPAINPAVLPYAVPLAGFVVLACGIFVGIVFGRALESRSAAASKQDACPVCSNLHQAEGAARLQLRTRRVRAGEMPPPAPYSYSSDHPERTLAAHRRRRIAASVHAQE
jgi:hypothetical protein